MTARPHESPKYPLLLGRIKSLLNERGISQAALAELTRLSASFISRLLGGKRSLVGYVEVLARALDVPAAELVAGTDGESLVCAMAENIPRETFEAVARDLATARTETQAARAEMAAAVAAREVLESRVGELIADVERLTSERDDGEASYIRGELAAAEHALLEMRAKFEQSNADAITTRKKFEQVENAHRDLLAALEQAKRVAAEQERQAHRSRIRAAQLEALAVQNRAEWVTAEAARAALAQQVMTLEQALAQANRQVQVNYDAYLQQKAQVEQARSSQTAAVLLGGLVGFGVGASAPSTSGLVPTRRR